MEVFKSGVWWHSQCLPSHTQLQQQFGVNKLLHNLTQEGSIQNLLVKVGLSVGNFLVATQAAASLSIKKMEVSKSGVWWHSKCLPSHIQLPQQWGVNNLQHNLTKEGSIQNLLVFFFVCCVFVVKSKKILSTRENYQWIGQKEGYTTLWTNQMHC